MGFDDIQDVKAYVWEKGVDLFHEIYGEESWPGINVTLQCNLIPKGTPFYESHQDYFIFSAICCAHHHKSLRVYTRKDDARTVVISAKPVIHSKLRRVKIEDWLNSSVGSHPKGDGTGPKKCRHQVRGFWRTLKSGKQVFVRPHERGQGPKKLGVHLI